MDELNSVAMREVLLNNSIELDLKELNDIRTIVSSLKKDKRELIDEVSNVKNKIKRKYKVRSKPKLESDHQQPINMLKATFVDNNSLDNIITNGKRYGSLKEAAVGGDPFKIIKPIMWMNADVSSFFDELLDDKTKGRFSLNLARHMWGTRVLSAVRFLPHERSPNRIYLRLKDPTGYQAFQNVMRCWYIWDELHIEPTVELFEQILDMPEFIKWYRYQLCVIMQSSRDFKRQKSIGPFRTYYMKLLNDGYKPTDDWSLDSERIPSKYYHPCCQLFDELYPISKIIYSLKCTEPRDDNDEDYVVNKNSKVSKKQKSLNQTL